MNATQNKTFFASRRVAAYVNPSRHHHDSASVLTVMVCDVMRVPECRRPNSPLCHTLIVYLAGASVVAELSEEATGASAVLTSAVCCTTA